MTSRWTWWPTMRVQAWPRRLGSPRHCVASTPPIRPNCDGGHRHSRQTAVCRKTPWCRLRKLTGSMWPARFLRRVGAGVAPRSTTNNSKIMVLSSDHDDPLDVLRCGEALSAVLLECTMAGMATCTLTHMIEFPPSRDIIRQAIGQSGLPQLLIRVGRSPTTDQHATFTDRRPLAEVLEFRCWPGPLEGGVIG